MPSPFPGMDPYLEGDDWTSFHAYLAIELAKQLTPQLRPKYIALPEKRFELVEDGALAVEAIYPDVGVTETAATPSRTAESAVPSAPVLLQTIMEETAPHSWVEIRNQADRRLVTTIEILSPWNKRGNGRNEYLDKRRKLLRSSSHLVEIDLLRGGRRLPMKDPLPAASYYVFVSRTEARPMIEVWPIALPDRLPKFPVPLLAGDADVSLDLQSAIDAIYDYGGLDLALDYSRPLSPSLSDEESVWATERLRRRK